jgi:hypothetical protein
MELSHVQVSMGREEAEAVVEYIVEEVEEEQEEEEDDDDDDDGSIRKDYWHITLRPVFSVPMGNDWVVKEKTEQ